MSGREVEVDAHRVPLAGLSHPERGPHRHPRDLLLEHVWGAEYIGESHLLQVNINRLRRKLELDAAHPRYIQTKTGVGYLLNAQPTANV